MEKEEQPKFEEKVIECKPTVIFDGICEHDYADIGDDPEGNGMARCANCPMGRLFDRQSYIIASGKLKELK